jgi:hypothetical protein
VLRHTRIVYREHGERKMQRDDFAYYSRRAEQELERGRTAGQTRAALAHFRLSELYRQRLVSPELDR